jgi:predicted phosphodiesterase
MIQEKEKFYSYDSINGNLVATYNSVSELEQQFGENISKGIRRAIRKNWKMYGLYWTTELYKNWYTKESVNNTEFISPPIFNRVEFPVSIDPVTDAFTEKLVDKIKNQYSLEELKIIAAGSRLTQHSVTPNIDLHGKHFRIGIMGDTHLGSSYSDDNDILFAFKHFKDSGVDFICHTGDVTEGMSNRPGHIYELDYLGYDKQKNHAIDVLKQAPAHIYMIDGNHDRWFIKNSGALIVKDICEQLGPEKVTFMGHDEGDIMINNNIKLRLWHGEDASSYALSYRIQKVVESLSGGDKPNILLLGHVHKFAYIFERNIQCVSTGCLQKQTPWMRGKRIAAHVGFGIIDVWVNEKGVSRFAVEWVPLYK